jgi:Spy/CpxP family protein refolding chaperone
MLLQQRMLVVAVAAAAGLAAAVVAYAQAPAQTPTQPAPVARLNLSQAQKDQVKAFRDGQRKDVQAVRERMRAAHRQLREAMQADAPDESAVRTASAAVAAAQADHLALRAQAKGQLMQVLTPEQRQQMKEARAQRQTRRQDRVRRGRDSK